MQAIALTPIQQAQLGVIQQEQGWAEAHEMQLTQPNASEAGVKFHTTHRDIALAERDQRLKDADVEVRTAYDAYMQGRMELNRLTRERLGVIDARIIELDALLERHASARRSNWRNYRSRPAHGFDAVWEQEKRKLNLEKFYLESTLATEPILWQQTA